MNLICGINPVFEALAAGTRHFDRLLIVKGLRSRKLSDAIRRATHLGIPLRFDFHFSLLVIQFKYTIIAPGILKL